MIALRPLASTLLQPRLILVGRPRRRGWSIFQRLEFRTYTRLDWEALHEPSPDLGAIQKSVPLRALRSHSPMLLVELLQERRILVLSSLRILRGQQSATRPERDVDAPPSPQRPGRDVRSRWRPFREAQLLPHPPATQRTLSRSCDVLRDVSLQVEIGRNGGGCGSCPCLSAFAECPHLGGADLGYVVCTSMSLR